MKISVVIATYRRAESLTRTLSTIAQQTQRSWEVIVVDQSPSPEREVVSQAVQTLVQAGQAVKLICSHVPSSTQSRNIGLKAATGDWVVFSDDDVDWPPAVLATLVTKLAADPGLALVGARDTVTTGRSSSLWRRGLATIFLLSPWAPLRQGVVLPCMQAKYPQSIIGDMPTEWATGYWFAVDRTFITKANLSFDEKMIRYAQAEDLLFTHQVYQAASLAGRRCIVSEDIAVAHRVTQEWRESAAFADLCGAWNRIYIAAQLRTGYRFWLSLGAIYWAALHQCMVRISLKRPWAGHLRAYWLALGNLSAIRAGNFAKLYDRYEGNPKP